MCKPPIRMQPIVVGPNEVMSIVLKHMDGRFRWGPSDCCSAACNVFLDLWGVDPMKSFRGRYSNAREARDLLRPNLHAVAVRLAKDVGLKSVSGPSAPGDIGVLVQGKDRHSLVINVGDRWAGKAITGVAFFRSGVWRSWRRA